MEDFGLADAAGRAVKTYSGGMRRRLDLAASLVGRPSVLYLDEPTTGLDPRGRGELWGVVRGLVDHGVTVLLTTQYLEEADQLADDIVVIDRGRVVATGPPNQLKAQVGGQVLEVTPAREADVGTVVGIVATLTGTVPDAGAGTVLVPVGDPELPSAILQRLTAAGVAVAELALRKPSLDEVFLTLTGHRASDETERSAA
jgi:oleandomycin transport system ATP-binding protein